MCPQVVGVEVEAEWSLDEKQMMSKDANHEILGAQHLRLYEKSKFFQSPRDKI